MNIFVFFINSGLLALTNCIFKYSSYIILGGLLAILNYEGMIYDVLGYGDEVEKLINDTPDNPEEKRLESALNHHHEFPYDWDAGESIYVVSLSVIFMGTIILEVSFISQKSLT